MQSWNNNKKGWLTLKDIKFPYKALRNYRFFSKIEFSFGSPQFRSVQSLSRVRLFATPLTAARQASLSISNSRSPLTLTTIGDAIQPYHPLSSPSPLAPKSLPESESFPKSQLFAWGGQSTGVSALASFLPMTEVKLCRAEAETSPRTEAGSPERRRQS